jgi:hypothetical protein
MVAAFAALALPAAGCARSAGPVNAAPAVSRSPSPATASTSGDAPSASARMICESEAAQEIYAALGVQPSQPPTPNWTDHLYSCRYVYPFGTMVLSIKELSDAALTTAYYASLQNSLANHTTTQVLGQPAFVGPDGSIVVRKDFKVLHVDVSGVTDQFGVPPHPRADAAFNVAAVIMSCWTGS